MAYFVAQLFSSAFDLLPTLLWKNPFLANLAQMCIISIISEENVPKLLKCWLKVITSVLDPFPTFIDNIHTWPIVSLFS